MATVDDKVVAMSFESSKFESGVNATINALNKLKASLTFTNAGKGLNEIDDAANKVDLSHIGKAVDSIKSKFSAFNVVAVAALANIVSSAVSAGARFIKSFTLDPLIAGFHNYETQINAVQTILANTGLKGKKGLDQVNDALAQLNTYANKTIFNFSEMAKNVGTFTAAGVGLKTSVESIKGIANLAALSGSSADQASSAMYQLSQAIAAGRVKLQDWNSVVNAGIGGKVFQKALFDTGQAFGTIKDAKVGETFEQWTKAGNTFRGSLQSGWLTSKVLTTTLKGFTGDMTAAQLKAQGFTDKQIKDIQEIGKTANAAATNIKTMSQLTQALKEEVATAWAAIFKTVFGNITQATTLFSKVHTVAENALTKPLYDLNQLLEGWAKLGGRAKLIDAIKTAFKALGDVMDPIRDAFREIFPPTTAKQLADITDSIDKFVHSLIPSAKTVSDLKRTFAGLFAILDIGKQVLGGIATVFGQVFSAMSHGNGGFLNLTGNIGDLIVAFDKWLKEGNKLHDFFVALGTEIAKPIKFLNQLKDAVLDMFAGLTKNASGGFSAAIDGITGSLIPFQKGLSEAKKVWDDFLQSFGKVGKALEPAFNAIVTLFGQLGDDITKAIQSINFNSVFQVIRTGLLAGIFVTLKKFLEGGFAKGIGGGVLSNISESFEALTGSLKAMEANIKANTILKIAGAVGILAASIVALSTVPADKMNASMSALAIGFGELLGAMKILTVISSGVGFVKIPLIAAGLIELAAAIDLIVFAVKQLSGLSWEELTKGLGGVGVLLVGISKSAEPLSRSSAGLISAGVGITAIAVAMKILASAVSDFGGLSWEALGKGIASVAVSLGAIGVASKVFPSGMVKIGLGLIGVATGLKILASAVGDFGGMDLGTIAKGIGAIAASLIVIAGAMNLMPTGMVGTAAGLALVSVGLKGIGKAVASFGNMSIAEIAKGLIALAGALAILAVALTAMTGTLAGSAALGIAAAGLALLAPALSNLGKQSWGSIAKSMITLAASMVILGAAGALLTPVAPAMLALGVAMLAIGGGLALAGAGIALIGTGLSAIAISGPIALGVLVKALIDFASSIPKVVASFVTGFVQIAQTLAKAAPQFVTALGTIIASLADAIIQATPEIVKAFDALMAGALKAIRDNFPDLVSTGFDMLMALLKGIKNHIGEVTTQVVQIIQTILTTVVGKLPQLIASGAKVLEKFLEGIADNIKDVTSAAVSVIANFASGIANNMAKIISAGTNVIGKFVKALIDGLSDVVDAGANAIAHLVTGLGKDAKTVIKAGTDAIGNFVDAIVSGALVLTNKGADAVINFLNGVAKTIRTKEPQMIQAGFNVGTAIVQGMINGIGSLAGSLISKVEGLLKSLPGKALHILGISSPSKVFYDIGKNVILGLSNGISQNADIPNNSMEDLIGTVVDTVSTIPDILDGLVDLDPTITPVLDLTQVQNGVTQMNSMLAPTPIVPATSSGQASSISASQAAASADETVPNSGDLASITFQQNNYSPESLSEIDIYRQTKNQLAQARNVLVPT